MGLTIDVNNLGKSFGVSGTAIQAAIELLDAGNTVPFIARYRKEQTGGLDEEQLRQLADEVASKRALEERRTEILGLLERQGNLSQELEELIQAAETLQHLEDLYRPYRPKRRTRASVAREQGLEPLADWLQDRNQGDLQTEAAKYISDEVPDVESALQGARDILAERLSDDPHVREQVRQLTWRSGALAAVLQEHERADHYRAYSDYEEPLARVVPHRVLALNRGEKEGALRVSVRADADRCMAVVERIALSGSFGQRSALRVSRTAPRSSPADEHLQAAAHDAYKRLIAPSIEREVRNELTERAQEQALAVFRSNLKALLMQPPLRNHVVMGLDPAYRTGVKVAVVDPTGRLLETGVIYPTPPHERIQQAEEAMTQWVRRHRVTAIAIGNGTASRETERFVAQWLKDLPEAERPGYAIVDEAGASVYSASPLAREEFPDLDVSERSAVSIARRLQDPLAELVKIEPRSLGVGQYQHDVDPKRLEHVLAGVVEDVVNQVGVDLNTASVELLSYVAGLTPTVAANIVAHRQEQGPFQRRADLKAVKRLGPRTFEQCAGFLQIPDGADPLDRTPIHPESYGVAEQLLKTLGLRVAQVATDTAMVRARLDALSEADIRELARQLNCGEPTLRDIIAALKRPGRDPREDVPPPVLRADVLELADLREGMVLEGTVRNVVDFGVFVDIGVNQDGLVHISELADHFVRHPLEVVSVGQVIRVRVLEVDLERQRIALSRKGI